LGKALSLIYPPEKKPMAEKNMSTVVEAAPAAEATAKLKTNGEFLKTLLETEASKKVDATRLTEDFFTFQWARSEITEETIQSAIEIFAKRIFKQLKELRGCEDSHRKMLGNIRRFFGEVLRIAAGAGLKVKLREANKNLSQY
jgi:hypothetical protein